MVSSSPANCRAFSNPDDISTHLRHSYPERDNYTTQFFGRKLDVAVTSNPHSVQRWINKSLYLHRHRLRSHNRHNIIVGLGTQWRPSQHNQCPATIQMCIGHRVLIYQILHSRSNSAALSRLLGDRRITFVGYNIGNDCRLLSSHYGLEVTSSTEELRSVSGMGTASMESMVERFLGFPGVRKPKQISTSDWDALELSVDQVQYAALDSYLSFQLGVKLVANPALRVRAEHNEVVGVDADNHYGSESESTCSSGFTMRGECGVIVGVNIDQHYENESDTASNKENDSDSGLGPFFTVGGDHSDVVGVNADDHNGSESDSGSSPAFTTRGECGVIVGVNADQHYGSESDSGSSPSFTVLGEHGTVVGVNVDHHDGSESDSVLSPTSTMRGECGAIVGVNADQHYGSEYDSRLSPSFAVSGVPNAVVVNTDHDDRSESDSGSSPTFTMKGECGVAVGVNADHHYGSESDSSLSPIYAVRVGHSAVVEVNTDHHYGSESDGVSSPGFSVRGGSNELYSDNHWGSDIYGGSGLEEFGEDDSYLDDYCSTEYAW